MKESLVNLRQMLKTKGGLKDLTGLKLRIKKVLYGKVREHENTNNVILIDEMEEAAIVLLEFDNDIPENKHEHGEGDHEVIVI